MRNIAIMMFCAIFSLPVILFPDYAGAAPAQEGGTTFKDVENREWVLVEIKGPAKNVILDRQKLETAGMGAFFTINFQETRVTGMGAPNQYFGPYTAGGNRTLTLGTVASTMMMAFREPDGLNEKEYFEYLSKIIRWDIKEKKLELYSSGGGGAESTLIFALK